MNIRDTADDKKCGFRAVRCPVCGAEIPKNRSVCARCMWVYDGVTEEEEYSGVNAGTVSRYRQMLRDRVRTVAVFSVAEPIGKTLRTGLQLAGVTWWVKNGKLTVLNGALADAVVFCRGSGAEDFLWGRAGEEMGRYRLADCRLVDTGEKIDAVNYGGKAAAVRNREAFEQSLNESRTFLSRARYRKAAKSPLRVASQAESGI